MHSMHHVWLSCAHSIGHELVWYHHFPLPSRYGRVVDDHVYSHVFCIPGTIYQNEPRYSLPHNHLVAVMDSENITVLETQSFVSDVREALKKLREKDVRIILGNFNEYWARKVFCEAYRLEMYGRSYQWLIMGTYSRNWWNSTYDTECSPDDLQKALDATILTDLLPLSTTGDITVSGIVRDNNSQFLFIHRICYN